MQTYGSKFEQVLKGLIDEAIELKTRDIATANYDLPDYRRWSGYIAGLRAVLDFCSDANDIISKD